MWFWLRLAEHLVIYFWKRNFECNFTWFALKIAPFWPPWNTSKHEDLNLVFANHGEEDEIYPLTTIEIAEAQQKTKNYRSIISEMQKHQKRIYVLNLLKTQSAMHESQTNHSSISTAQGSQLVSPHYLQHPAHSHLKETMRSMMCWKGMHNTIWSYVKSCRSCQINKRHCQIYGHVPPKLVITTPWQVFCVDLIGPYTKVKTVHVLTSCASLWLIQQQVGLR